MSETFTTEQMKEMLANFRPPIVPAEAKSELSPVNGSGISEQARRAVWEELESLKRWTKLLEEHLQNDPGGVVPWLHLDSISEATSKLIYCAGQMNSLRLARGRESPNTKLAGSSGQATG
jgi:hypothetical protein